MENGGNSDYWSETSPSYSYDHSYGTSEEEHDGSDDNKENPEHEHNFLESEHNSGMDRKNTKSVVIWVNEIPFEFGTLPVYPCGKMSLPILLKIIGYCRANSGQDTMPLGLWYHICKTKLRMSYHLGWTYIRLYNILFQQMNDGFKEHGYWDERCDTLKSKKYDGRDEFHVPTLKFMLFLFIQHSYRVMSKYGPPPIANECTSSDGDDEFFQNSLAEEEDFEGTDDEFDEAVLERDEKKTIEGEIRFQYVSSYLPVMIKYLESGLRESPRLKLDIVDALDLVLCAKRSGTAFYEKPVPLKELIAQDGILEYDSLSETVDRKLFILWVKRSLRLNSWSFQEWSIPSVVTGLVQRFGLVNRRDENRITSNEKEASNRWYNFSGVNDQVIFMDNFDLYACVRVSKCNRSYIYLTGAFSCVSIEWCQECTIFFGCISGVMRMTGCKEINFLGQVRQLILCETVLSTFHIHTPCSPLLGGNSNSQLYFGPYTSFYPNLEIDMELTDFGNTLSLWDKVRGISNLGLPMNCEHQWTRIEGKMLFPFQFPFEFKGMTVSNPVLLQARHNWVLDKKKESLVRYTVIGNLEKSHNLDSTGATLLRSIILLRFVNFLIETDLHKEILALFSYNESAAHKTNGESNNFEGNEWNPDIIPESLSDVLRILVHHAKNVSRTSLRNEESESEELSFETKFEGAVRPLSFEIYEDASDLDSIPELAPKMPQTV